MNESSLLVSLKDVVKHYAGQRVLSIEQLEFHRQEAIFLQGRNGSGKSTLLRLIGGISVAQRGTIFRHPRLSRAPLGFLPQTGGLYADLTVRQNLKMRRRLYGLPDIPLGGLWYIDDLGLGNFLDRRVAELSGGFQRLAAMAVTLHIGPRWLLLDEPLTGVDGAAREILKARLAALAPRLELCVVASPSLDDELVRSRHIEVRSGKIQ
jgi:ABC-type multidrug transport system ATPase subunit